MATVYKAVRYPTFIIEVEQNSYENLIPEINTLGWGSNPRLLFEWLVPPVAVLPDKQKARS